MNKKIKELHYPETLFIDIETVRGEEKFTEEHPFFGTFRWKFRDKETNDLPTVEDTIKIYNNKAALYPEWGKIVCISVGFINKENLVITSYVGEEKEILYNFVEMVKASGKQLCVHNSGFDIPFVRKRYHINGLTNYLTESEGNDSGDVKPWTITIIDTMGQWKGVGWLNTSLDELAMCFGIPSSKDKMKGNEVSDFYYAGKIKEIQNYCEKDVMVLANVIRAWKGDSLILKPKFKKTPVFKPLSAVERILKSGEIDKKTIKEIKELNLTSANKGQALEIVRAAFGEKRPKKELPKEVVEIFT